MMLCSIIKHYNLRTSHGVYLDLAEMLTIVFVAELLILLYFSKGFLCELGACGLCFCYS